MIVFMNVKKIKSEKITRYKKTTTKKGGLKKNRVTYIQEFSTCSALIVP
jgi:hypothetical protein